LVAEVVEAITIQVPADHQLQPVVVAVEVQHPGHVQYLDLLEELFLQDTTVHVVVGVGEDLAEVLAAQRRLVDVME
jgi:hypothetical protein